MGTGQYHTSRVVHIILLVRHHGQDFWHEAPYRGTGVLANTATGRYGLTYVLLCSVSQFEHTDTEYKYKKTNSNNVTGKYGLTYVLLCGVLQFENTDTNTSTVPDRYGFSLWCFYSLKIQIPAVPPADLTLECGVLQFQHKYICIDINIAPDKYGFSPQCIIQVYDTNTNSATGRYGLRGTLLSIAVHFICCTAFSINRIYFGSKGWKLQSQRLHYDSGSCPLNSTSTQLVVFAN